MNEENLEEYEDVFIVEYTPEIVAIHDTENDSWIYNVNLYQHKDKMVYRIRSQLSYNTKEDAILDANGVIELLGYSLEERIIISCFKVVDEEVVEDLVMFDGNDFYPYDGSDDEDNS